VALIEACRDPAVLARAVGEMGAAVSAGRAADVLAALEA
jgi:hypothetical protein